VREINGDRQRRPSDSRQGGCVLMGELLGAEAQGSISAAFVQGDGYGISRHGVAYTHHIIPNRSVKLV
jgi:hypothetical protein